MDGPKIIAVETSGRHGSVALAEGPIVIGEDKFPTDREHARELLPSLDGILGRHGWRPGEVEQCYVSIGPGSFTGLRVAVTFARHLALAVGARICAVPTLDVIAENCAGMDGPPQHLAVVLDAKRGQVFGAVYERVQALAQNAETPKRRNAETKSQETEKSQIRRGGSKSQNLGGECENPGERGSYQRERDAGIPARRDRGPGCEEGFSHQQHQRLGYRRIVDPCLVGPERLLADAPRPIAVIGEGVAYHRGAIDTCGARVLDEALWPPRASNVHRVGWLLAQEGRFIPPRELVPFYLRRPEAEEIWEKRHGGKEKDKG